MNSRAGIGLALLAILGAAAVFRFTALGWGLRHEPDWDERVFVQSAAWVAAAGATLLLDERWGVSLEYRLAFVRGSTSAWGSYNAGGNWLGVGLTYRFAPDPTPPPRF